MNADRLNDRLEYMLSDLIASKPNGLADCTAEEILDTAALAIAEESALSKEECGQ